MAGGRRLARLALVASLLGLTGALAQPTIVSTVPTTGVSGVSTTNAVEFTFSEAMDTNATSALFYNASTFAALTTIPVWSVGSTVMTCTPSPAFPASTEIVWEVVGQSVGGSTLTGTPAGYFTTGTGPGGGGGYGTNQHTTFSLGLVDYYQQTNTSAPTLYTNIPYLFLSSVVLASNRTALSATLELPSTSVSNLSQDPISPEEFYLEVGSTNQTALDETFGYGNYIFTVYAASSNQQVTVNLPSSVVQPGAPQIANYTAAQSVNSAQPFTLTWNTFSGGTSKDFIYVSIGTNFSTPEPGSSNAFPGTASSVVIPAGALQPNTDYEGILGFYHYVSVTNLPSYITAAYWGSITIFNLTTTGSAVSPMLLTNFSRSGDSLSFNVTSAVGQSLIIQYSADLNAPSNQWQTLIPATTNTTGTLPVTDTISAANPQRFYRSKAGP